MRISNPMASLLPPVWRLSDARRDARGALVRLFDKVMRWRERARERRQLMAMSERELRDIRLTRVDAWREANKPLWRE